MSVKFSLCIIPQDVARDSLERWSDQETYVAFMTDYAVLGFASLSLSCDDKIVVEEVEIRPLYRGYGHGSALASALGKRFGKENLIVDGPVSGDGSRLIKYVSVRSQEFLPGEHMFVKDWETLDRHMIIDEEEREYL